MQMFEPRQWQLAHGRHLELGPRAVIMGILNVTPDSFSDGGFFSDTASAVEHAKSMIADGAAIVDVGGESTRPGSAAVSAAEEESRVLPVIEALARDTDAIISVDTYRASTARKAVAAGAHIVNDIWGLQHDPAMAVAVAALDAGVVIMHNSRDRQTAPDPVDDQFDYLKSSLDIAAGAGIPNERIVLDPGFGFGKDAQENIALMERFDELAALDFPLLVATSRKRFIGHMTGRDSGDRDAGTAATSVILRLKGAVLFRVHDVAINMDALNVADAIVARRASS
ncbi:dihydropteroate synthase [Mesorhizobium xinjiangense]|uniref:dihydropteroate synthase n=1 Tax=Mesorhizobium xinjiangense TaxID=2678685 RepID=UPI001F19127B|nr:dihydropteroate synthase [Mesorhizobium xinjiangense]